MVFKTLKYKSFFYDNLVNDKFICFQFEKNYEPLHLKKTFRG